MSENNSNQVTGSCGPACEGESLIIEVMGKDHPEGHSFRIFDETNAEQQEGLENRAVVEELEGSVLHVWPWQREPNRNLWLEIAADKGDPVRVPFLQSATVVNRETERQRHVILPIIPTTLVSGVTLKRDNPAHHVMSRPGFIYLFHEGKLWRELEVRIGEQGVTRYHDVALQNYRQADGKFEPGYRAVTGTALSEIWVPARVDGRWISIHAAYSESQWPGARVNYLQGKPLARVDRCSTVNMELAEPKHSDGDTLTVNTSFTNAFLASDLAPQRSRNPSTEWQFDRPENYLLDLKGDYAASAAQEAIGVHQRQEYPDPDDPVHEDERPEMTALAKCLHQTLKEVEAADEATRDNEGLGILDWPENTQTVEDCVKDARDRLIGAIRLDDPVGKLRYLQQRRQVAGWFSNAAVRRAKARPYFDSALLMNAAVVPSNIGGRLNPLHKYMSEINGEGRRELERSIAASERKLAVEYGTNLQADLLDLLRRSWAQHSLVDLFTHDGYDYAGAFHFLASLIQEVVMEPEECDVLAAKVDGPRDGAGKEWLRRLCSAGHSELLYSLLFPRFRIEDLEQPYVLPSEPDENSGDGQFRASELASLEAADLPETELVKTRDGLELAAAAEAGVFLTAFASSLRTGAQTLLSIHGNMWGTIQSASQPLISGNQQLKDIDAQLKSMKTEMDRLSQERVDAEKANADARANAVDEQNEGRRQAEQARQRAQANLGRIAAQESEVDLRLKNLAAQRQRLLKNVIKAQMRLYAGSIQQLRASMPFLMGNVRLERLSKAAQKGYLVIGIMGMEEISEEGLFVQMFGDITEQGEGGAHPRASTNRRRARAQGLPSDKAEDVLVLVVPENEQMARILRHLGAAQRQYSGALKELGIWERYAAQSSNLSAAATAVVARRVADAEAKLERALSHFERVDGNLQAANDAFDDLEVNRGTLRAEVRKLEETVTKTENRRLYRVLNSPLLPAAVMLMELHNVRGGNAAFDQNVRAMGLSNALARSASAYYDLAYASVILTERFLQNVVIVERVSSQFMSRNLATPFFKALEKIVGGSLTPGKLLGGLGGMLMAFDYSQEANYLSRMGNTGAAVGASIAAAGGLAFAFASVAGSAGLLFLGPAGWLALGVTLAISGTAVMAWFSEEPVEIWMRHGPFGSMAEKPFLKEPQEAYYRLASLLMGVNVVIEPNPLRRLALRGELVEQDEHRLAALQEANTRLRVESAFPGLFKGAEMVAVKPHLQLVETKSERGYLLGVSDMSRTTVTPFAKPELKNHVLLEEEFDGGTYVYLKTPVTRSAESQRWLGSADLIETWTYHWNVRIQLQIQTKEGEAPMVFPAPDPEDPLVYNTDDPNHTEPDFSKKGRPFWYDEQVRYYG
ncbi:hypothetical protein [Marinobacter halophilus]|uniref:Uncharacterized protein n=1 Tax=Marinobacter halophilus TaxID=1323740 RepID=A0A2T1KHA0_9GAMM|nr:hypothetical protein [Marinobacter halophilus]PSF08932.1 hypothetical protein C7H08_09800 [Marinobacter halophilus]GGC65201.1 hypothetical protein GCM10011362_11890 [Marinobacter halophilus]